MSFLQNIESMIVGGDLQRLAGGGGNFQAGSVDHQAVQSMMSQAEPGMLENLFGQAADQIDSQQLASHLTPNANGANPLAALGSGGLSSLASMLVGHLTNSGGYSPQSLLSSVPELRTADPQQMDAGQVAALTQYTQQNHPGIFGRIMAMFGQQNPGMLQHLLGNAGMGVIAQKLAGHFMDNR